MDDFDAALARAEAAVHDDHFNAQAACAALLAVLHAIREPIHTDDTDDDPAPDGE